MAKRADYIAACNLRATHIDILKRCIDHLQKANKGLIFRLNSTMIHSEHLAGVNEEVRLNVEVICDLAGVVHDLEKLVDNENAE